MTPATLHPGDPIRIDGREARVRAVADGLGRVLVQWPTGHGEWVDVGRVKPL